jgi:hypothetical protein
MEEYEVRFVAFLDILGFSNLIEESGSPAPRISVQQIREALTVPTPAERDMVVIGRIGDISLCRHRLSHFSDCIVASTEPTEAGLLYLLMHVEKITFRLLTLGFLCRGGIVKGLLYHDDAAVFGPAVVGAYHIEKFVAKHPRIVIDEAVARWSYEQPEPVGKVMRSFILQHEDGHHAVHVLRRLAIASPGPEFMRIYQAISHHLDTEIARLHDRTDERKKVEWFKRHFHDVVTPNDRTR